MSELHYVPINNHPLRLKTRLRAIAPPILFAVYPLLPPPPLELTALPPPPPPSGNFRSTLASDFRPGSPQSAGPWMVAAKNNKVVETKWRVI